MELSDEWQELLLCRQAYAIWGTIHTWEGREQTGQMRASVLLPNHFNWLTGEGVEPEGSG